MYGLWKTQAEGHGGGTVLRASDPSVSTIWWIVTPFLLRSFGTKKNHKTSQKMVKTTNDREWHVHDWTDSEWLNFLSGVLEGRQPQETPHATVLLHCCIHCCVHSNINLEKWLILLLFSKWKKSSTEHWRG
jgi:hypothetical protein